MNSASSCASQPLTPTPAGFWAPNWERTRRRLCEWWEHRGLVAWIHAPADQPRIAVPPLPQDVSPAVRFYDPDYRAQKCLERNARNYFTGEAYPYADTAAGAGELAAFLGCKTHPAPDTVWFEPCITDPDTHPPIRFDPSNPAFQHMMKIHRRCVEVAQGRYYTAITDLVENLDILSAMRDPQTLMMEMIERPAWVRRSIQQITDAYFQVFDALYDIVKDPDGGNIFCAFSIWGPGKTAKVQCDACAMFSPAMFKEFVLPDLTRQCDWLDYAMYHLDGVQCICHLDHLLSIESLRAIQWTPQAGQPRSGDKHWYGLYKRILAGGKSVQINNVAIDGIQPLLDTIGPRGVFMSCYPKTQAQAEKIEQLVEPYRG